MSGYYDTGDTKVHLGEHCFATPSVQRQAQRIAPARRAVSVLPQAGGIQSLTVTAQSDRYGLGDAEWWIYTRLQELLLAEDGTLVGQDGRGAIHAYDGCVCVSMEGQVHADQFAEIAMDAECPESDSSASEGSPPSAVDEYSGRTDAQDYEADGVSLGVGGQLMIEGYRDGRARYVPRAGGARNTIPSTGAFMSLTVEADILTSDNVGAEVESRARDIGQDTITVTGNGNTYEDCVLVDVQAEHTDWRHTTVNWTFEQDLR